jgi:uncharacterized protein YjbI with pentapeptide repeats
MIISNSATTTPVQSGEASKQNSTPPADTTRTPVADAKPGTQGIKRLSSDAATVVLTEQGTSKTSQAPAKTPPPPPKLDLHGQDLRTADLTKLDLRGADLTGADLTGKNLSGIDLSGATLTGAKFDGATFSHTNLHGVTATGASFTKASFDETDLDNGNYTEAKFTGATFGANFQLPPTKETTFDKCYIVKDVNLTKADFSNVIFQKSIFFKQFVADDASFNNIQMSYHTGFTFSDGSLKQATFQGFKGGVSVCGTDASGADFSHISGGHASFGGAKIDGATFHDSDTELNFSRMDIRHADLSTKNRSLKNSIFEECDMRGIDFSGYDFSGAQFLSYGSKSEGRYGTKTLIDTGDLVTGTNFHGANFTNTYFQCMQMAKALFDDGGLRGAIVSNLLSTVVHVTDNNYDINTLFRNIWPEHKAMLAKLGR